MTAEQIIVLVLEIVGTIAFSISGAFVAIKAGLDLFGVSFVGSVTAVGGGIMRDIIVGDTPPRVFDNLHFLIVAVVVSLVTFAIIYFHQNGFEKIERRTEQINNIFDAVGLAVFSVIGTETAFTHNLSDNVVLSLCLGLLTGVGGGIVRDVLTASTPYIFKKRIYALASLFGCLTYYVLRHTIPLSSIASIIAVIVIVSLRMLATHFLWNLPKITLMQKTTSQGNNDVQSKQELDAESLDVQQNS